MKGTLVSDLIWLIAMTRIIVLLITMLKKHRSHKEVQKNKNVVILKTDKAY